MPYDCPWTQFQPAALPLCEELLCSWIRQPLNAWSNLAYLAVGIHLLTKESRGSSDRALGACALIVTICSFIAHASVTLFLGGFDYASIYLTFSYLIAVNFERLGIARRPFRAKSWGLISAGSTLVMIFFYDLRILIFAFLGVAFLGTEIRLFKGLSRSARHDLFLLTLTFLAGVAALSLDAAKTVCYPSNHFFQLHAFWHLLSAISLLLAARYLRCVYPDTFESEVAV